MIDASGNIIIVKGNSFVFAMTDPNGNAYVNLVPNEFCKSIGIDFSEVRLAPNGQYYAMWVNSEARGEKVGVHLMN